MFHQGLILIKMLHSIYQKPINFNDKADSIILGAGCFWGVEKKFWDLNGVAMTATGYAGGHLVEPTYEEVCSGVTNHAEVIKVEFDSTIIPLKTILSIFWECHDPTQGMRQGNDIGNQYRSAIYCANQSDLDLAVTTKEIYQEELIKQGFKFFASDGITTEIKIETVFFLAEDYHQQYLHKNPNGYCGIGGTGCSFPV